MGWNICSGMFDSTLHVVSQRHDLGAMENQRKNASFLQFSILGFVGGEIFRSCSLVVPFSKFETLTPQMCSKSKLVV